MNSIYVAKRILKQLKHEKRTLGLIMAAPLLLITLVYLIFNDTESPAFNFDMVGAAFLGIIVYFLVFLVAGINLLNERTSGMLERIMVTPIKRGEIVGGYILGFGLITVIQSVVLSLYYIYVLDITMEGSYFLVLLIIMLTSFNALTLGMLMSSLANNEFQMVQFIPLVIIPQIIFCGLFPLDGIWEKVGWFMPMYYVAEPLKEVILTGAGFTDIWQDVAVLAGLALIFAVLNIIVLKRYRKL